MLVNRNISKLKSRMFYMKIQHSFVFYFKHGRKLITWINRLSFIQNGSLNISLPALVKNKSKDIWFTDYTLQPMGGGVRFFALYSKHLQPIPENSWLFQLFVADAPMNKKIQTFCLSPLRALFGHPVQK